MNDVKHENDPHVLSATSLADTDVRNEEGERLGTIIDLMIDLKTGQIAYAVFATSTTLEPGRKLFALPWTALTVDTEQACFLLDADRAWLRYLPGFDNAHGPTDPPVRSRPVCPQRRRVFQQAELRKPSGRLVRLHPER